MVVQKNGELKIKAEQIIDEAYNRGKNDAKREIERAYQRGLDDAWEAAALNKPEACTDCKCGECRGCCTSEGK